MAGVTDEPKAAKRQVTVARADEGELPPLRVAPGAAVQVQLGRGPRLGVRLLALVPEQYLLFHGLSRELMTQYAPNTGDSLLVRYFYEGTAYAFRSYLLNVVQTPEPLLFVAYPRVVELCAMRAAERVACTLPCRLRLAGPVCNALLVDISLGGARVTVRPAGDWSAASFTKAVGRRVELGVQVPEQEGCAWVGGIVRRADRDGRRVSLGLQFEDSQEALFQQLAEYFRPE